MTKTIICQQCSKEETYIVIHKSTNTKKFCTACAISRTCAKINLSNKQRLGRPPKVIRDDYNMKKVFSYDNPNILGY